MGALYTLGFCCLCVSVWGVIQMTLLGFFYSIEASTLIEDVMEEVYSDITDFLAKTKANYQSLSASCYRTAYVYLFMILLSWAMIARGKYEDKMFTRTKLGEEGLCGGLTTK